MPYVRDRVKLELPPSTKVVTRLILLAFLVFLPRASPCEVEENVLISTHYLNDVKKGVFKSLYVCVCAYASPVIITHPSLITVRTIILYRASQLQTLPV